MVPGIQAVITRIGDTCIVRFAKTVELIQNATDLPVDCGGRCIILHVFFVFDAGISIDWALCHARCGAELLLWNVDK